MTKNALLKLGFIDRSENILCYIIKESNDFSIYIYADSSFENNEGVYLTLSSIQKVISTNLPNIKTVSQLKTFIKLLSNDNN